MYDLIKRKKAVKEYMVYSSGSSFYWSFRKQKLIGVIIYLDHSLPLLYWPYSNIFFLGHFGERNSSGTLTFFIPSRFLGRNSSEISLSGWHLVIFRAEQ